VNFLAFIPSCPSDTHGKSRIPKGSPPPRAITLNNWRISSITTLLFPRIWKTLNLPPPPPQTILMTAPRSSGHPPVIRVRTKASPLSTSSGTRFFRFYLLFPYPSAPGYPEFSSFLTGGVPLGTSINTFIYSREYDFPFDPVLDSSKTRNFPSPWLDGVPPFIRPVLAGIALLWTS